MDQLLKLSFGCHQLPHRSFFWKGKQFPLCARCTGIFMGYFAGIVFAVMWVKPSLLVSILLLVPLIIDGGVQYVWKIESTNSRRLLTGVLAGMGTDYILYTIIVTGLTHGKYLGQFFMN